MFNLVTAPWLWTTDREEVSLREVFANAPRIRGLQGSTSLMIVAQYRVLLAVLHRAIDGPRSVDQWMRIWHQKQFPPVVEDYLSSWKDRFRFYGEPDHPGFLQSAPPIPGVRERDVNKLVMHARAGGNVCLFGDGRPQTLSPGRAARNLVTVQAFSLGGGSSGLPGRNFVDGPCARGIVFLLGGRNLFETLMFNLLPYPDTGVRGDSGSMMSDCPAWEREDIFDRDPLNQKRRNLPPRGLTDLYTWPSRRVVLVPDEDALTTSTMQFSCGLYPDRFRDPQQYYPRKRPLRMRCVGEERKNRDATTVFDVVEVIWGEDCIEAVSWIDRLQQSGGRQIRPQGVLACGQASRLGATLDETMWRFPFPATERERERAREALEVTRAAEGKLWAALGQAEVIRRSGIAGRDADLSSVSLIRWRSGFRRSLQDAYVTVLNGADIDDYLEQVIQAAEAVYSRRTATHPSVASVSGDSLLRNGLGKIISNRKAD